MLYQCLLLFVDFYRKENKFLSVNQIEKGRCKENYGVYMLFCEKFVPCIIGKIKFRYKCYAKNFSDFCSVSDEAMACLVYANNYDIWLHKLQQDGHSVLNDSGTRKPAQRYFDTNKGRGNTYNYDGRIYFNKMYDKIVEDRKAHGEVFDEDFLQHMNETLSGGDTKRGKRKRMSMQAPIVKCRVDDDEDLRMRLTYNPVNVPNN
jgi:hypothetical protein